MAARVPPASSSAAPAAPMAPGGSHSYSVFVYGQLMADEVVEILLGRVPPSSPALLHNHQRFCVEGRLHPAMLPVAGQSVTGKVFRGITKRELSILDKMKVGYGEFVKETVEVSLTETPARLLACTYIWSKKHDPNLFGVWDFEVWKLLYLCDYLVMAREFMMQLQAHFPHM